MKIHANIIDISREAPSCSPTKAERERCSPQWLKMEVYLEARNYIVHIYCIIIVSVVGRVSC